jgi:exosortase D (VPLPA-CTERM-specific)
MMVLKGKFWNTAWFKPIVLLLFFVAAYWVPLKTMVSIWWTDEDYSYGFLIPIVSAYILWDKRKVIRNLHAETSWKILPGLIFFVLLSIYGILGSSGNISMPSLPILIILFTAFCFGWAAMKELIVPLGFLIFMIPVPAILERYLGLALKAISSKMGGAIITVFNIPVHVSGNIIDLGVSQLQVVDACSGMRYLFALLALGVIYAYFFEKSAWKRVAAVLSTIPIAVITNGVRIGITGILTDKYGVTVAEGFFHGFSGWVLFMVAFACLFLVGRILALFPPKEKWWVRKTDTGKENEEQAPEVAARISNRAFYTSIGLMAIVGTLSLSTGALPPVKIQGGLEKFPVSFAGWQGQSEIVDPEIVIESGAEESFSAFYQNVKQGPVSLYIGFRSTAFLSNENFFHSPTVCLPSSGWKILEETTHIIKDVPQFGNMKVTQLIMEEMGKKSLVYFWFQTKNKATQDKNINRFHLTLHALRRDNTYDLFIRPIAPISPGESIESAQQRMDVFVRDMMGTLLQFMKEKQYEER